MVIYQTLRYKVFYSTFLHGDVIDVVKRGMISCEDQKAPPKTVLNLFVRFYGITFFSVKVSAVFLTPFFQKYDASQALEHIKE